MNTNRIARWSMATALCSLLLIMGACSKTDRALLDTVPSTANVVSVMNVELLLKRAGCQVTGDGITLSPQLQALVDDPYGQMGEALPTFDLLSNLYGSIDLSEVVFVASDLSSDDVYYTFNITDNASLTSKLTSMGATTGTALGCDTYVTDDWAVAVRDAQGWAFSGEKAMKKAMSDIVSLDAKKSLAAQEGIAEFLHSENAVNVAALIDKKPEKDQSAGRRACVGVSVADNAIGVNAQILSPDGKVLDFAPEYQGINTTFLQYLPESYVAAAAIGCSPDIDWKALAGAAALVGGSDVSSMLQMALPMLSSLDGTVSVAVGPAGGAPAIADINLHTWDVTIMAHMPQDDIDSTLGQLSMLAMATGAKAVDTTDTMTTYRLPDGSEVYAGTVDGCLALSTREFVAAGGSPLADTFDSASAAVAVNIPAGSEIVKAFNLPWGFNFTLRMQQTSLEMHLSLNGSNQSVLQALLGLLD